ncbi:MAG: hypothetical protein KHX03_05520 [Clostridium sp.]|nr:hypothetical protein [Clostridium sp.]
MRISFIITIIIFLSSLNICEAKTNTLPVKPDAKSINIIYIHGAYETKEAFDESVRNVHDDMVSKIQNDPLMYKKLLKNGEKKIGEKEIIFFWADKTEENLRVLDKALAYVKNAGSKIAQFGRATLSHTLHDAIWISKPVNATPLLNNLNDMVKAENEKSNEVILYGYSAGSLLASQYLTQKMPVIDINNIKNTNDNSYVGRYFANVIQKHKFKPTCLDALKESKILFYTDNDEFVTNPNIAYLKQEFPKLDSYTQKYCSPEGAVKGIVVFGTPLTTFDSSAAKTGTSSNILVQLALKYIVEHDIFFIVLNYANDFIGMPLSSKPTITDLLESEMTKDTIPNGGFIYDGSGIKCRTSIISSHMAYWSNGKRFANNIIKTYNDGYKYFYLK